MKSTKQWIFYFYDNYRKCNKTFNTFCLSVCVLQAQDLWLVMMRPQTGRKNLPLNSMWSRGRRGQRWWVTHSTHTLPVLSLSDHWLTCLYRCQWVQCVVLNGLCSLFIIFLRVKDKSSWLKNDIWAESSICTDLKASIMTRKTTYSVFTVC